MSSWKPKATRRRIISCFPQIVQEHVPGWKIEQIAAGEKVKARRFPYSSQVYLLMLSQFLHLFSLNEIVDVSKIYAAELSRVRGMTPANLNTFSNANRTRDPKVMQTIFWTVYGIFRSHEPPFLPIRTNGRTGNFREPSLFEMPAIGNLDGETIPRLIATASHSCCCLFHRHPFRKFPLMTEPTICFGLNL